jgi:hypothetical protein
VSEANLDFNGCWTSLLRPYIYLRIEYLKKAAVIT